MSKKAKIIIWVVGGIFGLFLILFVGGIILSVLWSSGSSAQLEMPSPQDYPPEPLFEASPSILPEESYQDEAAKLAQGDVPETAVDENATTENGVTLTERKVIKTGEIEMVVEKTDQTVSDLESLAERSQGFVQSASVYDLGNGAKSGTVVIKVPAEKFETIFQEIKALALVLTSEQISGQDVTEEYVDLQARLRNAQAEEAQYLEILKKADKVEDMLKVSSYLADVRGEIEVLEGQLQYLENLTDMSTITIYIEEETQVGTGPIEKWKPYQTLKRAVKSLLVSLQKTVDSLIWILVFVIGLLLPIGVVIWLVIRLIIWLVRRRRAHRAGIAPPPPHV